MKRFITVLFILILTAACGQEASKEVVGANAGPAPTAGYIVQVGESYITEQDLKNELSGMPESRRANYTAPGGEERLLDEMIKREMFRQEAIRVGMDQSEEYRQRVDYLSRLALVEMFLEQKIQGEVTISDREVSAYYEEHKDNEFTNPMSGEVMPYTSVRENIRRFMVMEKQREAFAKFMDDLMERYVVKAADDYARETVSPPEP
ncbi:MAG: hypothetical protein ACNA74_06330 [Desulfurivibrio sp.]